MDLLAQMPNLIVAKIVRAAPDSAPDFAGTSLVLETRRVLKGESPPRSVRAFFTQFAQPGPQEIDGLAGTSAILAINHLRRPIVSQHGRGKDQWVVLYNPYTWMFRVGGTDDPLVERFCTAIRRADLDSLTCDAEVICVGTWDRKKVDTLNVSQWITHRPGTDQLEVFTPLARRAESGLYFLGRNESGQLEPLHMGAGEFEVSSGRVLRLDRPLDDVLRQVRARRFVAEAHRKHRDHP